MPKSSPHSTAPSHPSETPDMRAAIFTGKVAIAFGFLAYIYLMLTFIVVAIGD